MEYVLLAPVRRSKVKVVFKTKLFFLRKKMKELGFSSYSYVISRMEKVERSPVHCFYPTPRVETVKKTQSRSECINTMLSLLLSSFFYALMSLMAAAAGFSFSVLLGFSPYCGAFSSKISCSPEGLKKNPFQKSARRSHF